MKFTRRNNAVHLLGTPKLTILGGSMGEPASKPQLSSSLFANNLDVRSVAAATIMQERFAERHPLFCERIQYITEPFFAAYEKAREKLEVLLEGECLEQHGTFIRPTGGGQTYTAFYQVKAVFKSGNWDIKGNIAFIISKRELELPLLAVYLDMSEAGMHTYVEDGLAEYGVTWRHYSESILSMLLFLKYCNLETKVIEAGKKAPHMKAKYFNETDSPIEILDSSWFTTIVRTEGFTVGGKDGGFFRWQRYGPGLSQKEIKWIPAFQKFGYTRKAKIDSDR